MKVHIIAIFCEECDIFQHMLCFAYDYYSPTAPPDKKKFSPQISDSNTISFCCRHQRKN